MSELINKKNPRRIGLLGATGALGQAIIKQLEDTNARWNVDCHLILRDYSDALRLSHSRLPMRFMCEQTTNELYQDIDVLIHMVMGNDSDFLTSLQAWHAATMSRIVRTVFVSSAVVYGNKQPEYPADFVPEASPSLSSYASAKLTCEKYLRRAAGDRFQVHILRPSIVYGPGSNWILDAAESVQKGVCSFTNDGSGYANLIYVEDLAKACLQAAEVSAAQNFVAVPIGDGTPTTWFEFYNTIASAMGFDAPTNLTPHVINEPKTKRHVKILKGVRESNLYRKTQKRVPKSIRTLGLTALAPPPPLRSLQEHFTTYSDAATASIPESLASLYDTRWRIDNSRIPETFRLPSYTSLNEGSAKSANWLKQQGFSH